MFVFFNLDFQGLSKLFYGLNMESVYFTELVMSYDKKTNNNFRNNKYDS